MNFVRGPIDINESEKAEQNIPELGQPIGTVGRGGDSETLDDNLGSLLNRVSGQSTREIDSLIAELRTLRKKVQTEGHRIQRDIEQFAVLNQSVMQLTKIIVESMAHIKNEPDGRKASEAARETSVIAAAQEL